MTTILARPKIYNSNGVGGDSGLTSYTPSWLQGGQQSQQPNDSLSPYSLFRSLNTPTGGQDIQNSASSMLNKFQSQGAMDFVPQDVLSKLGQATGNLANYKPEQIDVGKVQTLPVEYYEKQIQDLSAPITAQYEKARALTRGDLAARGAMYDSEAYDPRIPTSVGALDQNFLEQIGNITRGVQIERMKEGQQNEQTYIDRLLNEGQTRRGLGLEGLTSGAAAAGNEAQFYGNTALQQLGLDANMINSLLGYGADRYKSEADLFSNIYAADTDYNKGLLDTETQREKTRQDTLSRLLELQGYQDVNQIGLWDSLAEQLGFGTTGGVSKDYSKKSSSTSASTPKPMYDSRGRYILG